MDPYPPPTTDCLNEVQHAVRSKRNPQHEALAAALMGFGSIAFVDTLFPWINPILYQMNATGDESPWGRLVLGGGITAVLFWGAFFFNRWKPAATNRSTDS